MLYLYDHPAGDKEIGGKGEGIWLFVCLYYINFEIILHIRLEISLEIILDIILEIKQKSRLEIIYIYI